MSQWREEYQRTVNHFKRIGQPLFVSDSIVDVNSQLKIRSVIIPFNNGKNFA